MSRAVIRYDPVSDGWSPGSSGIIFSSDWSTALGSGDAALRDTSQSIPWSASRNTASMEVVASTGLGFPAGMSNVLRAICVGEGSFDVSLDAGVLKAPASGDHRYYRHYVRLQNGTLRYGSDHSVQLSVGSGAFFAFWTGPRDDGIQIDWNNSVGSASGISLDYLGTPQYGKKLAYDVAYRVELHVWFPTGSSVQLLEIRIYQVATNGLSETLLYDSADFDAYEGASGFQDFLVLQPTSTGVDLTMWQRWMVGYNGPQGATGASDRWYGGIQLREDTWCGAY